ncbi:gamma-glutamyltransferase [Silvimonas iriomotensis]|uniref:Glutathione hydrolase proenzyme n=1 Tax=Silvimonas iriomotensis TaxID=449662 RepID=A0ABQ2P6E0_9NEIS|nr:gamma-glutamyltransferase [Silvimonas iriomotensis]GGP18810.1 gamma-glutamyltranspeptidase [Silvimonas iriomotensis]
MKILSCARAVGLVALLFVPVCSHAASVAPVMAQNGMVVSAQQLATRAGVDVLKKGGNAIDAAVAVAWTLAVVMPEAGNLGGGGFMTVQFADGRKTFLDFREKAPLAASANMYLDEKGNVVPRLSTHGYLAVGVPGTVAGMEYARKKYGTMGRGVVMAAAIHYAQRGYVLEQGNVAVLNEATADFQQDAAHAGAIFLNHGQPYRVGETLVQKDLARTLREIRTKGADGFYKGWVARALVSSVQGGGGIISQTDLDQYQPREMPPVECDYRGYHVVSAAPPSSGGTTICEILNIVEGYPLKDLGFHSAQAVHYQIEAMRHAYMDRNSYLGDPAFVTNPVDHLLDKNYAAAIRAVIDPHKAGVSAEIKPGVAPHEGSNTTHFSIVDKWGNAVSTTVTLNDWFGARVMANGTGVLLNDEMDDFTTKPGVPNMYGLVQGEANAIAPGKRPLSSMSPTIVTKDGKPVMVVGTPGGSRIITATLETMINVIDYDMTIQEAVDAPRFHQQWLPETTNIERFALSADTRKILEDWGQKFAGPQPANHVAAILIGAPTLGGKPVGNNRFYGANDPRRNSGLALGY